MAGESGGRDDLLALLVADVQDYAILVLDLAGNVATWNAGAERFKGYRAEEIIGRHFSAFYPAEDVAAGKPDRELEIAAREGRLEDEGWRVRKDGTQFWANVVITALRDSAGTLRGYGKVTRDLTERRNTELALRASEERFRLMVEGVQDYAILTLSVTGEVTSWNAGAERFKGYRAEEIIGRHFSVFYPAEDVAAAKPDRELEIAAREGRLEDEGWRVRKDGTQFWANVVITALRDSAGTLRGYGKVTRDLTERRAQEHAIHERERLVSGVLAAATECSIIAADLDGVITIFNTGAERMLGYRAEEMVGAQTLALIHDASEVAARARELGVASGFEALVSVARRGEAETREWTYVRNDGSRLTAQVTVTALLDTNEQLQGFIAVAIDVSERRRAEEGLRSAEEHFRRAFHDAPMGMAIAAATPDAVGRFLDVNRAMCDLSGYDRDRLLEMDLQSLIHPDLLDGAVEIIEQLLSGELDRYQGETRCVNAAGDKIEISVGLSLIRDSDGRLLHFIVLVDDVSSRKLYERQLRHIADHDPLTGLLNRARLDNALDAHVALVARYPAVGALLMIDIDHFKQVNDRLGHHAGDQLLISVARALQGRVRETDLLARLGGDEFAVLMAGGGEDEAQALASDLSDLVRRRSTLLDGGMPGGSPRASASPSLTTAKTYPPPTCSSRLTPPCTPPRKAGATASPPTSPRTASVTSAPLG